MFCGKKVVSPDELLSMENIVVLICSAQPSAIESIKNDLKSMSVQYYFIDEVIFKQNFSDVLNCYDILCDEESKRVYQSLIETRMCIEKNGYIENNIISDNQYFEWNKFASFIDLGRFVDCGAYVGDSIEKYIWYVEGVFNNIIAIEPDSNNFERMGKRVERLKSEWMIGNDNIELYAMGVGDTDIKGKFESYDEDNGLGSKFVPDSTTEGNFCEIVSLDSLIKKPYSFLKADIESYEYKMLLGAEKGIKQYKPAIAVCIYHNAVDMFSIPLLIKSFVPEYKMAIRHYSGTWAETVLYCWIDNNN